MASESDNFDKSGPFYLAPVDWRNAHHRRSIAASLVKGVYVQELDRQNDRCQFSSALAPPWWDFFHFQLIESLVDDSDQSFFGAIYGYKYSDAFYPIPGQSPPKYVIAFRGTLMKPHPRYEDLKLDFQIISSTLEHSPRFKVAMQAVQTWVDFAGPANIWLAGHSLGSAIALLAGKNMAKLGSRLETYLFNPPFSSYPLKLIGFGIERLNDGVRIVHSIAKAGIARAINAYPQRPGMNNSFTVLDSWIPYLFVNPSDPICCGYIGYFQHRQMMAAAGGGAARIGMFATQSTIRSLISSAFGKDSAPVHLIPSAYLTVNMSPSEDFEHAHSFKQWLRPDAHSLKEWWRPDLQCHNELHQFI